MGWLATPSWPQAVAGHNIGTLNHPKPLVFAPSQQQLHLRSISSQESKGLIFSARFFTFKPLKQPNLCNQKPSIQDSKELSIPPTDGSAIPLPIQDPAVLDLPSTTSHYFISPF
jgi:hypothetical protein